MIRIRYAPDSGKNWLQVHRTALHDLGTEDHRSLHLKSCFNCSQPSVPHKSTTGGT